jgi:hypothetical protein
VVLFGNKWMIGQAGRNTWHVIRLTDISYLWNRCCHVTFRAINMSFNLAKVAMFISDLLK